MIGCNIGNQSNRLVNLSHLLLSKIINYLNANVDRIVFSLVCKRWFNDRQRYLSFNTHRVNITNDKYMQLNSYKSIIIDQINIKTKCKVSIGDEFKLKYYDYLISKDELVDIDRLRTLNIDKVAIGFARLSNEKNKEYIKNLYRLISDLNISKLKNVQSCSALPMNITSLSFLLFQEDLEPGCLPPNLKTLKFDRNFDRPIKAGVLPNTLVKLNFNESFNQLLEPGVLPSSLKILKFKDSAFKQDIKVGTFTDHLEELEFSGYFSSSIEDGALPQTLRILEYAPTSWLPQIKTLSNLKTLSISRFRPYSPDLIIDLSCLPTSLSRLEIFADITLINAIPPKIRYLDVEKCDFDFDSIFKDRSLYQFDYLRLSPNQITTLDGLKIKELELIMKTSGSDTNNRLDIPFGIETLSVPFTSTFLHEMDLPSSVKKLIISTEIYCIDTPEKQYDLTGGGPIQELVIICNELLYSRGISAQIPSIIFPPNTLIELTELRNEKIWIRMIDNQYYLVYCQSPIIAAIVHKSQLYKYIVYCIKPYIFRKTNQTSFFVKCLFLDTSFGNKYKMTLIKSISMIGGNSLESVSNSLINASNGQSSSDSNNQEQCFGFGRRRTTNIIFGDLNVFGGGSSGFGCGGCGCGCGGFGSF
ncbi:hypothetical protein PPL_01975 [Heterostelium album PN500]|uniref:F-box domain-containing protein n=1 Tax=Heterostelium pallidum (strain ATCC 26659 / Pp 5 / PN500) TaxID=670386 RepID=D3B107_HETP5|nr:hypothetical protein PPL_01975 [Heterostelium album PN500]EFA84981.1 hypothetical protein PPL_01975 [Heterostelium album PN500]|eukprot:XP_020437091.1 hypothetical protein PPL_01975 [Heterostelium album PN500]